MNKAIHKSLRYLLNKRRSRPLAIAHRGASAWATENTLGAFIVANSLGGFRYRNILYGWSITWRSVRV